MLPKNSRSSLNPGIYELAARLSKEKENFVLATVVGTEGSTPAEPGAKMIIKRNGSTVGTLGGGCVEHGAKALAEQSLKDGKLRTMTFALESASSACGGRVKVMIEAFHYNRKKTGS